MTSLTSSDQPYSEQFTSRFEYPGGRPQDWTNEPWGVGEDITDPLDTQPIRLKADVDIYQEAGITLERGGYTPRTAHERYIFRVGLIGAFVIEDGIFKHGDPTAPDGIEVVLSARGQTVGRYMLYDRSPMEFEAWDDDLQSDDPDSSGDYGRGQPVPNETQQRIHQLVSFALERMDVLTRD